MKITLLGTGTSQGIPVVGCDCSVCLSNDPRDNRLRSGVLVEIGDANILIDTGPDLRYQMLKNKVERVDAILYTHEHNDHIIGLDDIRPINFLHNKDLSVYASKMVHDSLVKRFDYIFAEQKYPGTPQVNQVYISKEKEFYIGKTKIVPIEVLHGKLPILGYRIGDMTYLTDVKTISEEEMRKIKGTKVLVISALHLKEHHSHLNLDQAIAMVQEISPEQAYLTHVSHKMGPIEKVSPRLTEDIQFAYDGMVIEL